MQIQYVLTYVFDEEKKHLLCLIKSKGPQILIGKINVPGGKIEYEENIKNTCSRELFEETGLVINANKWTNFETYVSEEFVLYKFCTTIPYNDLLKAYTRETEIVFVESLEKLNEKKSLNSQQFTSDFWFDVHKITKFY